MTDIPTALVAAFPPSANLLLDLLRRQIDDAMLMQIARADYGEMAEKMMAELRPIRDHGIVPAPMHWQLVEVLTLTRFSNPDSPNPPPFEPGPSGRRGHQVRLFACTLLLRAMTEPGNENIDTTEDSSLANLLASAQVLDEDVNVAVARFLTWLIPHTRNWPEPVLFDLALVILATRLRSGRFSDNVISDAAEWVLAQDSCWREAMALEPSLRAFSFQQGFWKTVAAEFSREAGKIGNDDVRTKLQLCALLLEPG